MNHKETLMERIANRQAQIGIVGLGYVGLPLAVAFAEKGFRVIGVDIVAEKVEMLNRGESYVEDVADEALRPLVEQGLIRATTDYGDLAAADAISICVPTPLRKTKDPDISYIIYAADEIAQVGASGKLIILESTTYPGTTEEIILPRLIENGDRVGEDFFLTFSPERIDPGRTDYTVWTTPKVIGGMTPACLEIAEALYGHIVERPVLVSSPAAAEMVKLLENTFRAVNIALVNEVALMCDKLGLNVWEIVDAADTKPYGFMKFTPGPGVGGHCIPLDPHYLSWKLKTPNYNARFIELAGEINSHMPEYVVGKIADALNGERKAINGSAILILGAAYKPNIGDVRESPALDIIHLLQARGAEVSYNDPHAADLLYEGIPLHSIPLTAEALQTADCVVVVTNHRDYDWAWIADEASLIVDTRNAIGTAGKARVVAL
jgi:UDP-N-acetyl-D-glucosamine dehydrogenase